MFFLLWRYRREKSVAVALSVSPGPVRPRALSKVYKVRAPMHVCATSTHVARPSTERYRAPRLREREGDSVALAMAQDILSLMAHNDARRGGLLPRRRGQTAHPHPESVRHTLSLILS